MKQSKTPPTAYYWIVLTRVRSGWIFQSNIFEVIVLPQSKTFDVIVFTQSNICFSAMELLSMIWKMILQKNKSVKWQLKPKGILKTILRKFLCSEKFKSYVIELQSTDVITPTTGSFRQQLNPLQVKFRYSEKATKI